MFDFSLSFLCFPDSSEKAKKTGIENKFPLGLFFLFSFDFFFYCIMENDEVISSKQNNNDRESQDITLKKGVESINCDAEEKKKMKEGEYPI